MIGDEQDLGNFFGNQNLVEIVDFMARRYGKMPSEILADSIFDFTFNMTVMLAAMEIEYERKKELAERSNPETQKDEPTFKELGIGVKKVKADAV